MSSVARLYVTYDTEARMRRSALGWSAEWVRRARWMWDDYEG